MEGPSLCFHDIHSPAEDLIWLHKPIKMRVYGKSCTETFLGQTQIFTVKLYRVLDEAVRNKTHREKERKAETVVHSFFSPFKFVPYQLAKSCWKVTQILLPGLNCRGGIGSSETKKIEQIKDNIDYVLLCLFSNYCV